MNRRDFSKHGLLPGMNILTTSTTPIKQRTANQDLNYYKEPAKKLPVIVDCSFPPNSRPGTISRFQKRLIVIISIMLSIAAIHIVRLGSILHGDLRNLYYSYFSDLIIPFGFYFLLCINEFHFPFLRYWWIKSAIVFAAASTAETCQYCGITALGDTFDPIDYCMYGAGVTLAALVEVYVFPHLFKFWIIQGDRI